MPTAPAHQSFALSDPGGRSENQDAFLADDASGLWLVADGVGGLADGGGAARHTAAAFSRWPAHADDETARSELRRRIGGAHRDISANSAAPSATTLCLLRIAGDKLVAMWLGDSRLYRWRDGQLELLTSDHSLVQQLVDEGTVTASDAPQHPLAHVLTRAVGSGPDPDIAELEDSVWPGDRFLLCTDGLYRALSAERIAAAMAGDDPRQGADALMAAALAASPTDNVTLVTVHAGRVP